MSLKIKIRQLRIEITLFGLMLIIGFATIQSYWLGPKILKEQQAINVALTDFKDAKKIFKKAQEASDRQRKTPNLDLQATPQIRLEYLNLAEFLEARAVKNALDQFTNQKVDFYSLELKKQMQEWTNSWVKLTNHLAGVQNFLRQSEDLKKFLQQEMSSETNSVIPIANDLQQWLELIEPVASNYLLRVEDFRKTAAAMKREQSVGAKGELDKQFSEFSKLSTRIQADAAAIDSFVKINQENEIVKKLLIFSEAAKVKLPDSPVLDNNFDLRMVFYPLMVGSIGLLILLVTLCYRSFAILPLREQLAQKEAIIQQQDMFAHFSGMAVKLAHEIKNLMTTIYARLYTLRKRIPAGSPESTDTSVIEETVGHLNQIVKNFLNVSNPTMPKFVATKAEALLKEAQALLATQLEAKSIQLTCEVESDATFQADPEQFNRILVNLIQNAAESIEQNGTIILRARRDRIDLNGSISKVIVIEVEDNGPGIPPGLQDRLFDPFFSTKAKGTGLGLAISAQIIKKHSGSLNFESESGRTIFRIALPRK